MSTKCSGSTTGQEEGEWLIGDEGGVDEREVESYFQTRTQEREGVDGRWKRSQRNENVILLFYYLCD